MTRTRTTGFGATLSLALLLAALAPVASMAAAPTAAAPSSTASTFGAAQIYVGAFLNPGGNPVTDCHFEYGPTTVYGQQAPCEPEAAKIGDERQQLTVRATAGNYKLPWESEDTVELPFNASAAEVQAALTALAPLAGNVTVSGSLPRFTIDFHGALAATDVAQLEVLDGVTPLQPKISEGGADTATVLQGGLNSINPVRAALDGLIPGATYHLRLAATTSADTAHSEDGTFVVPDTPSSAECPNEAIRSQQHSAYLPDCRAYEMVSPPDKNGGEVMRYSSRTVASSDGKQIVYPSVVAFGDAVATSISTEYLSERSAALPTGWVAHAITPPQEPFAPGWAPKGYETLYRAFSPDLQDGLISAWSPLTDEPYVENAQNLYLRRGLQSPGEGPYTLLTTCSYCQEQDTSLPSHTGVVSGYDAPWLAGTSIDLSNALFESTLKLTFQASGGVPNAYESEEGEVRLAAMIPPPGSTECAEAGPTLCLPAPLSIAGTGVGAGEIGVRSPHLMAADGHAAIFTVPGDVKGRSGKLYQRIDGGLPTVHTVQVNASERTDCADHDPCSGTPAADPTGAKPATYWDASTNAQRIFFTSSEQLTDAKGSGLYLWSGEADGDGHHLALIAPATGGVIGASEDGHYLYFIAHGQLVPDQAPIGENAAIYLWHDGDLAYVGELANSGDIGLQILNTPFNAGEQDQARVAPDGHHLLFGSRSGEGLLGDHGGIDVDQEHPVDCPEGSFGPGCQTYYLYSADTGSLQCVSCDAAGASTALPSDDLHRGVSGALPTPRLTKAVSNDGRFVFFTTTQAMVARDTNGVEDAYALNSATGEVSLLSSGTDPNPSYFVEAGSDGRNVFILTRQRLIAWDRDGAYDLYDVRVDGGFPEPPPTPAPCEGASCPSSAQPPPAALPIGSAELHGSGNSLAKRPVCPKGRRAIKVRGKTRCVKPRKHNRNRSGK